MAVDKLIVKLDATQVFPKPTGIAAHDTFSAAAAGPALVTSGLWVEPYTNTIMLQPKQFAKNFQNNASVTRLGKSAWSLTSSHWDERQEGEDRFLISDGTDEIISSATTFDANVGFVLDFFIYGHEGDNFEALELAFGQWIVYIFSTGYMELWSQGDGLLKATGWLVVRHGESLCNKRSQLVIMPSGNGTLFIRRNGIAGISYAVPDLDPVTPQIITAAQFQMRAPESKIQFQLTPLAFPSGGDYYAIFPSHQLPKPPDVAQTPTITPEWLNLGGSVIAGIYEPLTAGQTYDDLVPFVADGVKDSYQLVVTMTPNAGANISPFLLGATVAWEPIQPEGADDPADISADVQECSIEVSDDAFATSASLKIRDIDAHPILGACNRRAVLMTGATVIFDGVLKDPPKLTLSDNGDYYSLELSSLAKYLDQPCMGSNVQFDLWPHVDAVKWLHRFAGIPDAMLECDTDTTPLRDTRHGTQLEQSELKPAVADTPKEWVEKVCGESRWTYLDGPLTTGDYGFRYIDPLAASEDATHHFYLRTSESAGEEAYDLVHTSLVAWSIEPEGNEVNLVGCIDTGELIRCIYEDLPSQDPTLVDYDPAADPPQEAETLRPTNWLGFRKIVTIPVPGNVPEDTLTSLTLRIGRELSRRVDMVEFEADWKPGLWRGSVVEIGTEADDAKIRGKYRVECVSVRFIDESVAVPIRRATYTAVKLDSTNKLATLARQRADQRLAKELGYYIRFGPQARTVPAQSQTDLPGHRDKGPKLGCDGPISRVVRVTDEAGLESFVLGANGLDEHTVVR